MLATKNYLDFKILEPGTGAVLAEWKGAEKTNHALPGDHVRLSSDGSVEIIEPAPKKPLVGILQLTSKYMYGMTGHGVPLYLCSPMNKGYPCFRVACKEKDRSQNILISFQFENWEKGSELPRGSLIKSLGPVENILAEAEALAILSSPWTAPRPSSIQPVQSGKRPILAEGTFNIDPPGCLDIDDVLTLIRVSEDIWRVSITIADVAEVVVPGSKEYLAAEKIGATTYQEGKAVRPMLHRDLSEKACSLLPGELRYGLALHIEWSASRGFLGKPYFEKVLVMNQKSYTYESIYKAQKDLVDIVISIASTLAGRKLQDSHEWIEQFMLFYNREAAAVLKTMNAGLLRVHDEPFQEKKALLLAIDPKLEYLAYKAASYAPTSSTKTHYGLNLETYCHASSPIRRFADLLNQQIIKDYLDRLQPKVQSFDLLAETLNRRQKEINAAERDYSFLRSIQKATENQVEGTFLWKENEKLTFYIASWNTIIRIRPVDKADLAPGEKYNIQYFCDRSKANWKERMIFRLT